MVLRLGEMASRASELLRARPRGGDDGAHRAGPAAGLGHGDGPEAHREQILED